MVPVKTNLMRSKKFNLTASSVFKMFPLMNEVHMTRKLDLEPINLSKKIVHKMDLLVY